MGTSDRRNSDERLWEEVSSEPTDQVIGRATRASLLVLLGIFIVAGLGLLVTYLAGRSGGGPVDQSGGETPGPARQQQPAVEQLPRVSFTDVTDQAGIDFIHHNGATGLKFLPETMGGGVAFTDIDGDGDPDILLVNGTDWPGDSGVGGGTSRLYMNDGSGIFSDVTEGSGLDVPLYGMGVTVGDYDGDGARDLFISAVGRNLLLRNVSQESMPPRFEDVTESAGLADDDRWSTSSGFFDADGDGDLDLLVANYIQWSPGIDLAVDYQLTGVGRAYGPPTNFKGEDMSFYRNMGDGTFDEATEEAGFIVRNPVTGKPMGKSLGLAMDDIDSDGDIDVVVANDTVANYLFRNNGDGTFSEIGAESGIAYDRNGSATGAMGIDIARTRNDGSRAIAIGNFANEMSSFYLSRGEGMVFSDDAITEGIGPPTRSVLSFGLLFMDVNLDGLVDLVQTNGHIEDRINTVQPSQRHAQSAQVFINMGPDAPLAFAQVPGPMLGDLSRPIVGRGSAYADMDADGDLDIIMTQVGGAPMLLRNDLDQPTRWLRIRLAGNRGNPDAVGARVSARTSLGPRSMVVMPTRSYLSHVEPVLTLGLADGETVDAIEVQWPDGATSVLQPPDSIRLNREIVLEHPGSS